MDKPTPPLSSTQQHRRGFRDDLSVYQSGLLAQGFWALQIHRFGDARRSTRLRLIRLPWAGVHLILSKLSEMLFGIYLGRDARIGKRLLIEHFGHVIVHNNAVIGDDVTLRQGTTIGVRHKNRPHDAPTIGSRVDVGAGAVILGAISIGDDARIGANAVVLIDVPAGGTAVGVPARLIVPRVSHTIEDGASGTQTDRAADAATTSAR